MAKLNRKEGDEQGNPEDLVQAFAPCGNFPKERHGVLMLAQALARASKDFGIEMAAIVRECSDSSSWCPTPADIRNVAMSMRDSARNKRKGSQFAEWEQIYGPPDPNWSANMLKTLGAGHADQKCACHEFAIRCMLFYTEGEGIHQGDREFWEGGPNSYTGRAFDLDHHPQLVEEIRKRGGWRTERELQS